ncbi:LLM class F420-dependent oxidoreductase [Amycolatopsis acidiphila]|uniref:LLM class F420-dependent oxidoreductase n=1 Tax=Amycolatopsis acidiphila TaxID=715473 RepID=A0A557ZML9_9PSEU|nr:LLM class F420-dependent oxidoreductase [Amycolatopsis acidiphila]TVT13252.1 LLM class F420-dependent oxidoreductase [Amycolatopsis acidiphila]UIJ58047.1 LLM class F420-dependent oxidoreductase [Amycolatopsis acidiphila]GHG70421.1 LLM class F420-dependent oxidoreductase [Amycolatopsis acidiphila]
MKRWGITIPLPGMPLTAHRELIERLPDLGYTDAWTAETAGTDAFSPLLLASQWAPRLRLGTAIVPVYTRGPGLLAMHAATLAEVAPERFVLGIGTSSPVIVSNWNAAEFTEPYARTRDTLRFLRSALAGEKVSEQYPTFSVQKFKLERVPPKPPQVMLAALRPGMLKLAAKEADGAITNWLAPTDVPKVRGEIGPDVELVARIFVCPTEDRSAARALGRMLISSYLTVPVYAAFHEWLGRGEALAKMHELWAAGDRKGANAAIPDEVVDELIVHGSAAECRERLESYVDNGLTTPVISVLPTGGDPAEQVEALAPR